MIFCCTFIHFAAETSVSWWLMYSARTAKALTILSWILFGIGSILCIFVPQKLIISVFTPIFILSDTLLFLSCLAILFNRSSVLTANFKMAVFGLSLHFIGGGLRIYVVPAQLYYQYDLVYEGFYWVLIMFAVVPAVYLSRFVLTGHCNEIGQVQYEKQPYLKMIAQFINPLFAIILLPSTVFFAAQYQTTEVPKDKGYADDRWAQEKGLNDDLIMYLGWPMGFAVLLYLIYVYNVKNIHTSNCKFE